MPAAPAAGGVPPIHVSVRITTTGAGAAAKAMGAVTSSTKSMSKGMAMGTITTRTLGDAMRMTSSLLKYTVAGAFMNAGKQAIYLSRQFELSFSRIKGLVGVGNDALESMRKRVLELGGETTRAPLELAEALYFITSAGIKDSRIAMEVLENAAKAAAAGLGETNVVADAVTSTLNAYGTANYSAAKATDILVATVREGKAEADTFAPALGKVLPVAAAFGAKFEDVSAAIAALSRGGLSAGTSAIYVRQTLSQLLKPSKQAQEALKGVGTSAEEIRDNVKTKGLFPALQELSTRLGGVENASDFTRVFGNVRALTAVLSLVGPAAEGNAEIFERLNNATGDLDYAFEQYVNTTDASFNKAMAEQQAAMIKLGDSLKPLVVDLLKVATAISKVFGKLAGSKIVKPFIRLGAVVVIAVAAFASMLKTGSALIRLFSNVQISLFGTQFRYDAVSKSVQRYTTGTMTASTATGIITTKIGMWTTANGFLAVSIGRVAVAMQYLMKSLGVISIALSIMMVAWEGLKLLWKFFTKDEFKGASDALSKVNEVLDETVKYAESGITVKVDVDYKKADIDATNKRIREQFEENYPDLIPSMAKAIGAIPQGIKPQYIAAIMQTTFAGATNETRQSLIEFFADAFTLNKADIQSAIENALPQDTENAVTNSIITVGLVNAAAVEDNVTKNLKEVDVTAGIDGLVSNAIQEVNRNGAVVTDRMSEFGKAFIPSLQEGEIGPLLLAMEEFTTNADFMALSASKQANIFKNTFGPALEGLTGDMDLVSDAGGNLRNVFMKTDNELKALKFISKITKKDGAAAQAVLTRIRLAVQGVSDSEKGAVEASALVNKILLENVDVTGKAKDGLEEVGDTVDDIADKFSSGLARNVQESVDAMEAANSAIKEYQKGQEALMFTGKNSIEANIAFRDSLRDLGEAAQDSGGKIYGGSKNADDAKKSLIDSAEALLDVVNVYAASGDSEKAMTALGQGSAQIFATALKNGVSQADVESLFDELGFDANIKDTILNQKEEANKEASGVGEAINAGIAQGLKNSEPMLQQAVRGSSAVVIKTLKDIFEIESPSKKTSKEVGKPVAQGISIGFKKETASSRFRGSLSKSLDSAMRSAFKSGGGKGLSVYLKNFLDKKGKVETPAQDFVKETIGRMKDIIGSLGDYINKQLNFRNAKADLAKLINMQRGLDSRRNKALRAQSYAETRFGADGGAMVTGYEQAQIDALQLDFERVSRDYAMGRASYVELVDAEINLFEARAAAAEVSDEVLKSQNNSVDAAIDIENAQLEVASSTVKVMQSYQDLQESAAELYMNHKELNKVYNDLAVATGIASGKLQVGSTDLTQIGSSANAFVSTVGGYVNAMGLEVDTTKTKFDAKMLGKDGVFGQLTSIATNADTMTKAVGASFVNMGKGLLDPNSEFAQILKSLGPAIGAAIEQGANEAFAKSPLNLEIPVNVVVSTTGGSKKDDDKPPTNDGGELGGGNTKPPERWVGGGLLGLSKRAVGGPVSGMSPYIVGEQGPEMFVPKVSGTIVTNSALERYARTRPSRTDSSRQDAGNNIVVTVNNPVPAAAEDSITRRMKVLANSGLFG